MLRTAGVDRFSLARRLGELDEEMLAHLGRLYAAQRVVAARRVERIDAVASATALQAELEALRGLLPQLVGRREAERVWRQLEPLLLSLTEGRPFDAGGG